MTRRKFLVICALLAAGVAVLIAALAMPAILAQPAHGEAMRDLAIYISSRRKPGDASPALIPTIRDELAAAFRAASPPPGMDFATLSDLLAGAWDDPSAAPGRETLARLRPAIDAALARLDQARFSPDPIDPGDPDILGKAIWTRSSAACRSVVLCAALPSMRESAHNGNWPRVVAISRTMLRLADAEISCPLVTAGLVQGSYRTAVCIELRRLATETEMPEEAAVALIGLLASGEHDASWLADIAEGEQKYTLASLDTMYTSGGLALTWVRDRAEKYWDSPPFGLPGQQQPPSIRERLGNLRALAMPRRASSEAALRAHHARLTEWVRRMDPAAPVPSIEEVAPGNSMLTQPSGVPLSISGSWRLLVTDMLFERRATIAALRLRAHRAAHGRWPSSLADAAPSDEQTDPLTGHKFDFRQGEENAPPALATASTLLPETSRTFFPAARPRLSLFPLREPSPDDADEDE